MSFGHMQVEGLYRRFQTYSEIEDRALLGDRGRFRTLDRYIPLISRS